MVETGQVISNRRLWGLPCLLLLLLLLLLSLVIRKSGMILRRDCRCRGRRFCSRVGLVY